ncbi:MAG: hypothetical protein V4534_01550 [Myxococcota bacterium]
MPVIAQGGRQLNEELPMALVFNLGAAYLTFRIRPACCAYFVSAGVAIIAAASDDKRIKTFAPLLVVLPTIGFITAIQKGVDVGVLPTVWAMLLYWRLAEK